MLPINLKANEFDGFFYTSSFGFTASNVSEDWVILTKETSDKVLINTMNYLAIAAKAAMQKQIVEGSTEYLFYNKHNEEFNSNILVNAAKTKVPLWMKKKFFCSDFENNLKRAYGKEVVNIDYCNIKKIHGVETLTFSSDGVYPDTKSIGYFFNTDKKMVRFFLSCKKEFCSEIKRETESIFKGMQFGATSQIAKSRVNDAVAFTKKALPKNYCKNGSFFRECFDLAQKSCIAIAERNINQCVNQHLGSLSNPERFKHAGEIIGRCSGTNMSLQLTSRFKNTYACNNWKF